MCETSRELASWSRGARGRKGRGEAEKRENSLCKFGTGNRKFRQRRDAVAAREKELGRFAAGECKYYRLYLYSGKLALPASTFDEFGLLAVALQARHR
jgi:hypothetical protein